MQTNFHAQLNSLIALAIGTLRQRISTSTVKVTPQTYYIPFAEGWIVSIDSQNVFCLGGEEYPFNSVPTSILLQLIDEVTANAN
jgi:hypothetical protein